MGKQMDVLNLIQATLGQHQEIEAIDLDYDSQDCNRLKISVVPKPKQTLDQRLAKELEQAIACVYSGKRQIMKLVEQRFTRDDFPELTRQMKRA
jgi:hypothetical protein